MATYDQVMGEDYMPRIRRAVIDAGLQPTQVRADGIEHIGDDKVSVQVMDTKTRQVLYRAILDLPPREMPSPPVGPEQKTDRVWILTATDWNQTKILDVYSSPLGAEAGLKKRHEEYLDYIKGYSGEEPSEQDKAWLEQVGEQPGLGYHGEMDIYERRVRD